MGFNGEVIWSGNYDNIENKDINLSNQRLVNLNETKIYEALKETIDWYLNNQINVDSHTVSDVYSNKEIQNT